MYPLPLCSIKNLKMFNLHNIFWHVFIREVYSNSSFLRRRSPVVGRICFSLFSRVLIDCLFVSHYLICNIRMMYIGLIASQTQSQSLIFRLMSYFRHPKIDLKLYLDFAMKKLKQFHNCGYPDLHFACIAKNAKLFQIWNKFLSLRLQGKGEYDRFSGRPFVKFIVQVSARI